MSKQFEAPVFVADSISGLGAKGHVPENRYQALSGGVFLPTAFKHSAEGDGSIAFADIRVKNIAAFFAERMLREESAWWDGFASGQHQWPENDLYATVSVLAEDGKIMEAKEAIAQGAYPVGLSYEIAEGTVLSGMGTYVAALQGVRAHIRFSRESGGVTAYVSTDAIIDAIYEKHGDTEVADGLASNLFSFARANQLVIENITETGNLINPYYS